MIACIYRAIVCVSGSVTKSLEARIFSRHFQVTTSCWTTGYVTIGNAILSMSTRTRELWKGKQGTHKKQQIYIPPESERKTRIALEN
jgi:hypothetical protein